MQDAIVEFSRAACTGQLERAAQLRSKHPDIERSMLGAAALGDAQTLAELLGSGTGKVQGEDNPGGLEPLAVLCFSHFGTDPAGVMFTPAARVLIDAGADVGGGLAFPAGEEMRAVPLLSGAAAIHGDPELCRALLEAGADANDGFSMFHSLAAKHLRCTAELLRHGGDLADSDNPRGTTPLHWCLDVCYDRSTVEWLLQHDAPTALAAGPAAETALHVAVRRRRVEILEALVKHGADLDGVTAGGMTAYRHALRRNFHEVCEQLAHLGADTSTTRGDDLAVALLGGDVEAARALVEDDPSVTYLTGEEARLLPDLAAMGRLDSVVFLLDAGVGIAARGLDGGTALHQCAWFGQPEVAELLIGRGAPLNMRGDDHDSTPLGWVAHGSQHSGGAKERGDRYARIARALLEDGASWAMPGDPKGRVLLEDARGPVVEVLRSFGVGERDSPAALQS